MDLSIVMSVYQRVSMLNNFRMVTLGSLGCKLVDFDRKVMFGNDL